MPRFPCPRARTRRHGSSRRSRPASSVASPTACRTTRKQAAFEEDVIVSKGYPSYFLVVADFINWAKRSGIRVGPGRGSGAGSMCAYAMGITDLDPMPHGLIFERFLNPERMSMPDFDVDFDERRRGEVIRYVTEKYGEERSPRSSPTARSRPSRPSRTRAACWATRSMGEKLTKAMPPAIMGKGVPLAGIFDPEHKRYHEGGDFRAGARRGRHLEGGRRHGQGPRGPEAAVGSPRGWRHHEQRAAHRRHPDHEAACRTARSSPSSTTRAARRSAWSRWTSSACATSRSSTTPSPTSRTTGTRTSTSTRCRRT